MSTRVDELRLVLTKDARDAADQLYDRTARPNRDVAIVFGTGWDAAADQLGLPSMEFPAAELPGFFHPGVPGHAGKIRLLKVGQHEALVFRGRKHLYEYPHGQGMEHVMHYVMTAKAAGCRTFIHTNAVGGMNADLKVGQLVVVKDHNDLISYVPSPLRGPNFLDCSELYSERLLDVCRRVDPNVRFGTIANVCGPHFETPAAAQYLRSNGIDVVGMSMIPEAIMARHLGMEFLGVSLVTDVLGDKVSHEAVQAVVKRRAPELGEFLRNVIESM